jgi:hypothetical protein
MNTDGKKRITEYLIRLHDIVNEMLNDTHHRSRGYANMHVRVKLRSNA